MPWLERASDKDVEVCVLEVRGTNRWERAARAKNRGRTRLIGEHATSDDARAAPEERVQQLTSDGFTMIDSQAGVDAPRPSGVSLLAHLPASGAHVRRIGYELIPASKAIAERELGDGDIANVVGEDVDVYDQENG